jgi:hypothetical protein
MQGREVIEWNQAGILQHLSGRREGHGRPAPLADGVVARVEHPEGAQDANRQDGDPDENLDEGKPSAAHRASPTLPRQTTSLCRWLVHWRPHWTLTLPAADTLTLFDEPDLET